MSLAESLQRILSTGLDIEIAPIKITIRARGEIEPPPPPTDPEEITITGGKFMFVVEADHPDIRYNLGSFIARDSEGNVVPDSKLEVKALSSNTAAITIISDSLRTGDIKFVSPGPGGEDVSVNLNVTVHPKGDLGTILRSYDETVIITSGKAASVQGGSLTLEGLTPQDETLPPPDTGSEPPTPPETTLPPDTGGSSTTPPPDTTGGTTPAPPDTTGGTTPPPDTTGGTTSPTTPTDPDAGGGGDDSGSTTTDPGSPDEPAPTTPGTPSRPDPLTSI